jgi:hypothetical protein
MAALPHAGHVNMISQNIEHLGPSLALSTTCSNTHHVNHDFVIRDKFKQ